MEMQCEPQPAPSHSYMDFEPYCVWRREGSGVLAVHLHGFKREQLRVQVNRQRMLTICGQRPLDETKWSRFTKQIKLPDDCMEDGIRAKFGACILTITMPKRLLSCHNIINHKKKTASGVLKIAWKVAAVVLVLALSGAYVNCVCKHRSYAQN